MAVDYAALLKRYMQHVLDSEGTTFVEKLPQASDGDETISAEECAELIRISDALV
ncbi:hypothetical protein MKK84_19465 [Methylobacterium sp. E-065]|uniref:hypothetical protein n=1 Tax=Methylobacterium sp. E-065 TaxID=2836583 RepID=UPI001FBABD06|nr:hypothetical protein [Methylobacterium sp. E-065]MCJ2019585.1 hypothetical protein [Methylobacterium sp. E-065]